MTPFDVTLRTRFVHGAGAIDRLGALVRELGGTRALLVTDPGVRAAGHAGRGTAALEAAGVAVELFDAVRPNPTSDEVDACAARVKAFGADVLVGLGGGSAIDTAKGANFVATNGGRIHDYWGHDKATRPMLPLVAVPTTAGTGTESQSYALISDPTTHRKMACGDHEAAPRIALLDPTLTLTVPRHVTAVTGIDTLGHAVEAAVTKTRHPYSLLYAHEAFRRTVEALPVVLARPDDLEARAGMQLAAAFAGTAIELSMLGAAHAAANPLTQHFDVEHGVAVGLMLPAVVRFNAQAPDVRGAYVALARAAGLGDVDALVATIERLLAATRLPDRLGALRIPEDAIDRLADGAAQQWTAQHNPRPLTRDDFRALYRDRL